jgi:glyoxylase-like metal-dependent hydrolase (beta-lactamase superfamily II)
MIFEQLFEPQTSTYTYLIASETTRDAALVDPVIEDAERYVTLLSERQLRLQYTLETHVHADHVTAGDWLRKRLGSRTIVHERAGVRCADVFVRQGSRIHVGEIEIEVRETPGHTDADVSYVIAGRVLTGDALFIGGCGRTDFQSGNAGRLYDSVHTQLFTLPSETLVYPGHDYRGNHVSTIAREIATNPRLGGGRTRDEFVEIMAGLALPHPKQIERALPANRACGQAQETR